MDGCSNREQHKHMIKTNPSGFHRSEVRLNKKISALFIQHMSWLVIDIKKKRCLAELSSWYQQLCCAEIHAWHVKMFEFVSQSCHKPAVSHKQNVHSLFFCTDWAAPHHDAEQIHILHTGGDAARMSNRRDGRDKEIKCLWCVAREQPLQSAAWHCKEKVTYRVNFGK